MESSQRRVISLLVDTQSGVLARVSRLFCRRGFHIGSLAVSGACLSFFKILMPSSSGSNRSSKTKS